MKFAWHLMPIEIYIGIERIHVDVGQQMSNWFFVVAVVFSIRLIIINTSRTRVCLFGGSCEQIHVQIGPILFVLTQSQLFDKQTLGPVRIDRERLLSTRLEKRLRPEQHECRQTAVVFWIRRYGYCELSRERLIERVVIVATQIERFNTLEITIGL